MWNYKVNPASEVQYGYHQDLLNGVGVVDVNAVSEKLEETTDALYEPIDVLPQEFQTTLKLVPYYTWANRQNGQMKVWLNKN